MAKLAAYVADLVLAYGLLCTRVISILGTYDGKMATIDTTSATISVANDKASIASTKLSSQWPLNEQIKSPLEALPVEILVSILKCLSSPEQLYFVIRASPTIYQIFRSHIVSILVAVVKRAIHPAVLPLAVLICDINKDVNLVRHDGYFHVSEDLCNQPYFLFGIEANQDIKQNGNYEENSKEEAELNEDIRYVHFRQKLKDVFDSSVDPYEESQRKLYDLKVLVPICRLYSIVDFFVGEYCRWCSMNIHSYAKTEGHNDTVELSSTFDVEKEKLSTNEYARLQRAFFWFEIHRRLFSDVEDYAIISSDDADSSYLKSTTFPYLPDTTNRELQSVSAYLVQRMSVIYFHSQDFIVGRLADAVAAQKGIKMEHNDGKSDNEGNNEDEGDSESKVNSEGGGNSEDEFKSESEIKSEDDGDGEGDGDSGGNDSNEPAASSSFLLALSDLAAAVKVAVEAAADITPKEVPANYTPEQLTPENSSYVDFYNRYICDFCHEQMVQRHRNASSLVELGLPFIKCLLNGKMGAQRFAIVVQQYCKSRQHRKLSYEAFYGSEVNEDTESENTAFTIWDSLHFRGLLCLSSSSWPFSSEDARMRVEPPHLDFDRLLCQVHTNIGHHIWDFGRLDLYRSQLENVVKLAEQERAIRIHIGDIDIYLYCADVGVDSRALQVMDEALFNSSQSRLAQLEEELGSFDYLPPP